MTHNPAACFVTVASMLVGCVAIPDYVLEREQQRQQLYAECATALDTVERARNPSDVSLAACDEHQTLAARMLEDFFSRAERDGLNVQERKLIHRIVNDVEVVSIEGCYANVRQGRQVSDSQGCSGIAVCDRKVDELRHRQTLEAIKRAEEEAIGAAILFQKKR